MGNLAQEKGSGHSRRNDCSDSGSPNEHTGVVRRGLTCSLETHLPDHANQCINGKPSPVSSIMGKDAKSMVEVPHGYATDIGKVSLGLEQAKAAIGCAYLDELGWLVQERKVIDFRGLV